MIEQDTRKAIFILRTTGMKIRQINRRLDVSRNTVRKIIEQEGQMPESIRKDKITIDPELPK